MDLGSRKATRTLMLLVLVACGGALGAGMRSVAAESTIDAGGSATAWLLGVNLLGSFVLGAAFVRLDSRAPKILDISDIEVPATELPGARAHHPIVAAFLAVGFCGALTTWSSLAHESVRLWMAGEPVSAILLLGPSVLLGPVAVAFGARVAARRS